MNTTSKLTESLRDAIEHPRDGVVGIVDDLLRLCPEQDLRLDWQANGCRLHCRPEDSEEAIDLPIRKSVFRAMLARIAVLCNEQTPNSVSPYGGESELTIGTNPPAVFRISFANTPTEQMLELTIGTSP